MAITLFNEKYYVDEDFVIKRNKITTLKEENSHTHDFVELIYVYKGRSTHIADNKKYTMNKGDLLFVNYSSTHSFVSEAGVEYVNIIIKPDYISESLSGIENAFALLTLSNFIEFSKIVNTAKCHMHFNDDEQITVEKLIELMEKEKDHSDAGSEVILRSTLDVFLTLVFRKMSLPLNEKMYLNSELLEYIKNNCGEMLTLKKISSMCYYNSSYFSRAFKNFCGRSFVAYLTWCRMERACDLLINTELKVELIMEKCGFTNRTAFFKKFYNYTGLSPLQYRKCKK
ncbi:MAG: helix-turn-helix domain-containing protein [Clostridia bacterium]|nr:helix-turn-helix domain-containing protein [Clostridia bacterium]